MSLLKIKARVRLNTNSDTEAVPQNSDRGKRGGSALKRFPKDGPPFFFIFGVSRFLVAVFILFR